MEQLNLYSKRVNKAKAIYPSEDNIQASFFSWLKLHERQYPVLARFYAIPNGGFRHKATAAKMLETGTKRGVLDTCLPISRKGFVSLWIEFKSQTGRLSPEQLEWIEFLESENHLIKICRTWHDAAEVVIDYLGLSLKLVKPGKR